jgi:hypothetical protein
MRIGRHLVRGEITPADLNASLKFLDDHACPWVLLNDPQPEDIPTAARFGDAILHADGSYRIWSTPVNSDRPGWTLYPPARGLILAGADDRLYVSNGSSWRVL